MKRSCVKGCFWKNLNKEEILNQVQDDNRRGFTLIELLVVVLIIGILAAVAVPQYQKAVAKSRIVNTLPLLVKFHKDQEVYYLANGEYAATWEELATDTPVNTFEDNGRSFNFKGNKYILTSSGAEVWIQMYSSILGTMEIHLFGAHHSSSNYAGKRSCVAFKKQGREICKSWGGQEFESTNSWTKYWLP